MSDYYKPCKEFDECNRLIEEYYHKKMFKECFDGHLKLAEEGYPLAECQVAWFYYGGVGVEKNLEKSFYWMERAALHGDRDAQCNLGDMFYLNGIYVNKDFEKAKYWLIKASLQDNDYAQQRCNELGIEIKVCDDLKVIPGSENWIKVFPLHKGWSKDKKYIVTDKNNNKYLLRISSIELYEKKKKQFEILKQIQKMDINASIPISFGKLNDTEIYTLLTYLEGIDAKDAIKNMTEEEVYNLGYEAGSILYKLHEVPIDDCNTTWFQQYQIKMERKIKQFKECKLEIPNKDELIKYYENHVYLINDRPLSFTHGDYHIGNFIVNNGKIGIIDFDKNSICDKYDDFKPFYWNVESNPHFEKGLIDGYFKGEIPNEFFPILALYACESLISFLPWAISYGEDEIKTGYQMMDKVLDWYDNFNLVVPKWYK